MYPCWHLKSVESRHNGPVIQFLGVIQLMASGVSSGVDVADVILVLVDTSFHAGQNNW